MLDIMHVYHHLQNKQKLMMQCQENEFGDKNSLEIIAVYHYIQNQRNLMIQSRENARKPQTLVILGQFCPGSTNIFSSKVRLRHLCFLDWNIRRRIRGATLGESVI